ncbi:MAG: hypothetical protein HC898_01635 [Phycisphaerales bacterium]|nr:hypothetical protein [Phycisphaerales bacterium]
MATTQPAWMVGRCLRIGDNDQMLGLLEPQQHLDLTSYLMHDCEPLPTIASFYRRELFQRYGMFDSQLQYAFDYEFVCRLLAGGQSPVQMLHLASAQREHNESRSATHPVDMGLEYIAAARRYADQLPLPQRVKLWRNCDQRQRIYALAQAEMQGDQGRGYLWQQLLYRPWWLVNGSLRQMLVRGGRIPTALDHPEQSLRQAA